MIPRATETPADPRHFVDPAPFTPDERGDSPVASASTVGG